MKKIISFLAISMLIAFTTQTFAMQASPEEEKRLIQQEKKDLAETLEKLEDPINLKKLEKQNDPVKLDNTYMEICEIKKRLKEIRHDSFKDIRRRLFQ